MSKLVNKFGCHIQINKDCIYLEYMLGPLGHGPYLPIHKPDLAIIMTTSLQTIKHEDKGDIEMDL